jgi:shikimate dehydrogenase
VFSAGPLIDAKTRLCAVYGHPIQHSASPAMQNAAIAELGLNWRYAAFDVHPEKLPEAIAGAAAMKFIGLNLTVPHKILALPLVDHLDESARKWGAVNTICFETRIEQGTWQSLAQVPAGDAGPIRSVGFNTDGEALVRSLREDLEFEPRGRSVLLLGSGGAGRTAALRLAEAGIVRLYLINRTESKAEALAAEIRSGFSQAEPTLGYPAESVDLVLNATSLGLKPEDSLPYDEQRFSLKRTAAVYDMIYRPSQSALLQRANAAGCRTANGLGMLLYQGARAFEIWAGRPAPIAAMRRALEANVYGR